MKRTLKEIGREVLKEEKIQNAATASTFRVGEAVQFYKDGWRYGHVQSLGVKLRLGMVQVEHPITGSHWVKASDVRTVSALKACRVLVRQLCSVVQFRPRTRRSSR